MLRFSNATFAPPFSVPRRRPRACSNFGVSPGPWFNTGFRLEIPFSSL
ncbi:MAG: hypothetical protein ACI9KE_006571, partial [Polyangiales bacterium]